MTEARAYAVLLRPILLSCGFGAPLRNDRDRTANAVREVLAGMLSVRLGWAPEGIIVRWPT